MSGSALRFDYSILQLGRRVCDQQLWCLGFDVRVKGFPLTELGWFYHPRNDKSCGCGRMCGVLPSEGHLSLWGFGFLACDTVHGALWLGRKSFRPEWAPGFDPNRGVWLPSQLPAFAAPDHPDQVDCVLVLLADLADRLAEHEEDVLALLGFDYRQRCLEDWPFRRCGLDPLELPEAWRQIAQTCRRMRERPEGIRR